MNTEFWQGKRVFLTGHTGFKGGWTALWLERLGAEVTGYALPAPTRPSLFEAADVGAGIRSLTGDVRDAGALARAVAEARPEVVLHQAAQSLVRRGYEEPLETYSTNVLGTAALLEAVRRSDTVRVVVSVTSDKCYRNDEARRGYREDDPLGGRDPYSNSKACAELVTAAYRDSYFSGRGGPPVAVASARSGNVVGGGDWAADRLLPDLVRGFSAGEPVPIRRPDAVRPWQHVLEPVRGYLHLAERLWSRPELAGAWNFGPDEGDARPVGWVADRVARLWGDGARWELDGAEHPPEATYLRLDCSKARSELGWTPILILDEALDRLVEWYRAHGAGRDMRELTLSQIAAYQEAAAAR